MIKKVKEGYRVVAESGRNMGTYATKEDAERRLRQVEYFKRRKKPAAVAGDAGGPPVAVGTERSSAMSFWCRSTVSLLDSGLDCVWGNMALGEHPCCRRGRHTSHTPIRSGGN